MNISFSRQNSFERCRRLAFNENHRGLVHGTEYNLITGAAVHDAIAHGMATKDWASALRTGYETFDKSLDPDKMLPGESLIADEMRRVVAGVVDLYAESFATADYTILGPEMQVRVPIPGSEHNCIFKHHTHYTDKGPTGVRDVVPPADEILAGNIRPAHLHPDPECSCMVPHHLVGKVDAVVRWYDKVWVMEHKTTSFVNEEFWQGKRIEKQALYYMYAVYHYMGIKPHGVLLNALRKPSAKQVQAWNSKRKTGAYTGMADYLSFTREPILHEWSQVERAIEGLVDTANEWERNIAQGTFHPALSHYACMAYHRKCDYYDACLSNESPGSLDGFTTIDLGPDFMPRELVDPNTNEDVL